MNRSPILPVTLAGVCLLALTACPSNEEDRRPSGFNQGARVGTPRIVSDAPPPPTPTPRPTVVDTTPTPPQPPAPPPVDYPYATPVPGKPGFVISPHAPDAGYVDVRGMSPGQQARDPYTQKIFLVP